MIHQKRKVGDIQATKNIIQAEYQNCKSKSLGKGLEETTPEDPWVTAHKMMSKNRNAIVTETVKNAN